MNILSKDPNIYTIDDVLSEEECEHFIQISKDKMERAKVTGNERGGYVSAQRTGSNTWITHNHDDVTLKVAKAIAEQVNMPLENAEKFQIIHYDENQEYRNHYDSWDHNGSDNTLNNIMYGGARMRTALVYLNNVEEGGGTHMSKLDITVEAKRGRMLVFDNVYEGTNIKHELSEHAGTPVIRGEKYAFNLWFRECKSDRLYSEFNPDYYKDYTPEIKVERGFLTSEEMMTLVEECVFKESTYPSCYIENSRISEIIKKLELYSNVKQNVYENASVVLYKSGAQHGPFCDAFDLDTDIGKNHTSKIGQRLETFTFVFRNTIGITFPNISTNYNLNAGDLIYYKNTNSLVNKNRNSLMEHIIANQSAKNAIIVNIYVRERSYDSVEPENALVKQEDYMNTLKSAYNNFNENATASVSVNSFTYSLNKLTNQDIMLPIKAMKERGSILKDGLLERDDYIFDEVTPIKIENVIDTDILAECQKYYRDHIAKKTFELGDYQSLRYKHHNEPISRYLQYECLPLIEKIVKKKLLPTYTYLSAYIKGSDLPPHTDREDCKYTVSFLIDKPEGSSWPIYFHTKTQPIKYNGHYNFTPPLDECIPIDCEAGGMMMFCGQDHIHFREKLPDAHYTIVLLHYREL